MGTIKEEPKIHFYEAINEANINAENHMLTVCDGDYAGEKILYSAGETAWMSDENGFFSTHKDEIREVKENGLFDIDGVRIYSEFLGNEKEIVICGAGHVSMSIIRIAKIMGCRVTAIDDREQFVQNALINGADEGMCMSFDEALAKIPGNADTFFIIVTRNHRYDRECLLNIVKKPHAYIGMIGSRHKVDMVKRSLYDAGTPQNVIDSVYTPIGMDIGAETPEEIAVAIMAEIIEVKNKKKRNFGFPHDIMKMLLSDGREPAVLATIVSKRGSSPRGVGTRMLVDAEGGIIGTIGGGMAEAAAITKARNMLKENRQSMNPSEAGTFVKPYIYSVDMDGTAVEDEGMICGGAVEVLLEIV